MFVRVRYTMGFSGFGGSGGFRGSRGEPPWMHDYPTADIHMMKILNELTVSRPRIDGSNVLALDDPELFDYPIAYMSEPGYWSMSDEEAMGLRLYLQKGGFIIFDDFRDNHWYNLEEQMKRVLPDGRWVPLDTSHKVFHSFFEIDGLDLIRSYGPQKPEYLGHVRRQRSEQEAAGDRELQQRSGRVLGVLGSRHRSGRSVERGVQVRRELLHLWIDSLTGSRLRLTAQADELEPQLEGLA